MYWPSEFDQADDIPQSEAFGVWAVVVAANNKVEATVRRRKGLRDAKKEGMLKN